MQFTFKENGSLRIDMSRYIDDMLKEYNVEVTAATPAAI